MNINERIKQIRKDVKLSQEEFATKINLAGNSISRIENGSRNPSERTLSDICQRFNVNKDWLLTGNGEMYDENNTLGILALLQTEFDLDTMDIEIIKGYIHMAPIERQVFKDFIKNIKNKKSEKF